MSRCQDAGPDMILHLLHLLSLPKFNNTLAIDGEIIRAGGEEF
jgi:hypothetical protein